MYFDGRYGAVVDRYADPKMEKQRVEYVKCSNQTWVFNSGELRQDWASKRLANAQARCPADSIQPLLFADGREPKCFPRRLAGFWALSGTSMSCWAGRKR